MKLFATLVSGLLVFTMNGQVKKGSSELHTRPISLLQGIITLGAEVQVGEDVSVLFDGGGGTSALDGSTLTTFMIGARRYFTPGSTATRREDSHRAVLCERHSSEEAGERTAGNVSGTANRAGSRNWSKEEGIDSCTNSGGHCQSNR